MAKKYCLKVIDKKVSHLDFKLYQISFTSSFLTVESETFDLHLFYKKKYLTQLLINFKDEKNTYFLLSYGEFREYNDDFRHEFFHILSLTSWHHKIIEKLPKKKFVIFEKGKLIYLFRLDQTHINNLVEILDSFERLKLENDFYYFILDTFDNQKKLFLDISKSIKNETISEKDIILLSREFIKIKFANKLEEDEFKIFTCRFTSEELANIIVNSTFVDSDKFEVMYK